VVVVRLDQAEEVFIRREAMGEEGNPMGKGTLQSALSRAHLEKTLQNSVEIITWASFKDETDALSIRLLSVW